MNRSSVLLALAACAISSCASPSGPPDLRMRVRWSLTDPAAALPSSVDSISVDVFVDDETMPENSIHTVAVLEDADENGRPELVRGDLPNGVPIRMRVEGRQMGLPRFVGHAGPFVLRAGERRYVDLAMFPIDDGAVLTPSGIGGRFLHTATALDDGRVLIAGGFDVATTTTCPSDLAADARCYALTATDDALVFDPTTGDFHAVQGAMIEARAGHTATLLADGRVLHAGGAASGLLAFSPQAMGGFSIVLRPLDAMGARAALATFEIFDPEANAEGEDVDADGDPGRGGFFGAADAASRPGRLDRGRFLAAAARVPGGSRVLIAGGDGGAGAPTTYTVFDPDRAGGYGVLPPGTAPGANALTAPRIGAAAVALGSGAGASIWIVGGTLAISDAQLAEVWTPGGATDPNGSSAPASTAPLMFPQQAAGGTAMHPEWSLFRPIAEPVSDDDHALVVGWYGPQCDAPATAASMPVYPSASVTELCPYSASQLRSFTIDGRSGLAAPTMRLNPHAFSASAVLDDGRIVVTGGITSLSWDSNPFVDVYSGQLSGGAAALESAPRMLEATRALHTSTALPDSGVLSFGGIRMSADVRTITLIGSPEVHYLARR